MFRFLTFGFSLHFYKTIIPDFKWKEKNPNMLYSQTQSSCTEYVSPHFDMRGTSKQPLIPTHPQNGQTLEKRKVWLLLPNPKHTAGKQRQKRWDLLIGHIITHESLENDHVVCTLSKQDTRTQSIHKDPQLNLIMSDLTSEERVR